MKLFKKTLKWVLYFLLIPISYIAISLLLSSITISAESTEEELTKTIYLTTNGVHLDLVLPKTNIDSALLSDLHYKSYENYLAFGWGDEDFYINTPTWGDLTLSTALKAMFLKSSTLVHITRYRTAQPDWIEIKVSEKALEQLNAYLLNSFDKNTDGGKTMLPDAGYSTRDDFYKATGNYSCFKTCNTWVNTAFKESGLKASLWTPFDFGLMNKYK